MRRWVLRLLSPEQKQKINKLRFELVSPSDFNLEINLKKNQAEKKYRSDEDNEE